MIGYFLAFQFGAWHQQFLSGHFREELITNEKHAHYRRLTKSYKRKKSVVKGLWLVNISCSLVMGIPALAVMLLLLTTMLSFCILDETQ